MGDADPRAHRRLNVRALVRAGVRGILLLAVFVAVGTVRHVWPPDVWSGAERVLLEASVEGQSLQLVQYWNRVDFYSTIIRVRGGDDRVTELVVDGDDRKIWRARLRVDRATGRAVVFCDGLPCVRYDWRTGDLDTLEYHARRVSFLHF